MGGRGAGRGEDAMQPRTGTVLPLTTMTSSGARPTRGVTPTMGGLGGPCADQLCAHTDLE